MQKTILIVDFEQESLEELQQVLQSEEFLVLTAVDGQQALSVFETVKARLGPYGSAAAQAQWL